MGPTGASTAYAVERTTTVTEFKSMIENQEFIPGHLVRLVNGDEELVEGTLFGNGVEDDAEVDLMLEIPGGMRKKWKKKRMRRLRRKRRKMRQRPVKRCACRADYGVGSFYLGLC